MKKIQLITAKKYTNNVIKDIKTAKHSIYLTTTTFHNDCRQVENLITALSQAVSRGVYVSVLVDTLTYTEFRGTFLNLKNHFFRGVKAMKLEKQLRSAGIDFHWVGRNSSIGFAGRTHCKWIIIDDIVYSFGGININQESFENTDYMFRVVDKKLADWIAHIHKIIGEEKIYPKVLPNGKFELSSSTKIWFDGGFFSNSRIYRQACQLASDSDNIIYVSQYSPTGRLFRLIQGRPKFSLYFNRLKNSTFLNSLILRLGRKSHWLNKYRHSNYLHAKFILSTKNNQKTLLTGSHNFVRGSGIIGTREIAIETTDPGIISEIEKFARKNITY